MSFKLGTGSLRKLQGVDPRLVEVVQLAITITSQDFSVTEGLRTREYQQKLVDRGASKTLNSLHIEGRAVDLVPYFGRGINPWPTHAKTRVEKARRIIAFENVARAMFEAADRLGVPMQWGADWDADGIQVNKDADESFMDMPHFQLPQPWRMKAAQDAAVRRMRLRELGDVIS